MLLINKTTPRICPIVLTAYVSLKGDIVEVEDDGTIFASETGVTTVYATVHGRIFSCKVTVLPVTEDIEDPDVEIEY